MNIEELKKQLIIDEGKRNYIYLDSEGFPTFGIGHFLRESDVEWYAYQNVLTKYKALPAGTRPSLKEFLEKKCTIIISEERINEVFAADLKNVCVDCRKLFNNFDSFLEEVQQIVANMMFNLGLPALSKFKKFIAAIKINDYRVATAEMINTKWYNQVGIRSKRLALRMEKLANNTETANKNEKIFSKG